MNVPPTVGMLLSWCPQLVEPLARSLGLEEMWDLIEIQQVDSHNARVLARRREDR